MAKIQLDESLFADLCRYHLADLTDDEIAARIRSGLQEKLDAVARRRLYTDSKTAPTAAEREAARQRYLDEVGITKSFRW